MTDDLAEPVTDDDSIPPVGDDQEPASDPKPDREAARYRRQLREAETARDGLLARVDTLQRAEVARIAKAQQGPLHNAADLLDLGGVTLEQLRNEAGDIDEKKVTAALEEFRKARAYLFQPKPKITFGQGRGESVDTKSWSEVINGSHR